MTCRSSDCKHEFCWICKADWKNHSHCGTYSAKKENELVSIEKYLHYWKYWNTHRLSQTLEKDLQARIFNKMEILQDSLCWIDVQYVKLGLDELIHSRQILKNSYIQAYYLSDTRQEKALFEMYQSKLESITEKLSYCLEQDPKMIMSSEYRLKIIDYTALIKQLIQNFY